MSLETFQVLKPFSFQLHYVKFKVTRNVKRNLLTSAYPILAYPGCVLLLNLGELISEKMKMLLLCTFRKA